MRLHGQDIRVPTASAGIYRRSRKVVSDTEAVRGEEIVTRPSLQDLLHGAERAGRPPPLGADRARGLAAIDTITARS
jgi:hypothetical protein